MKPGVPGSGRGGAASLDGHHLGGGLGAAIQGAADADEDCAHDRRLGQEGHPEVVAVGHVEARTGHHQHAFGFQQVQGEGVIVEALGGVADHRRERVQRAGRGHQGQVFAGLAALDGRAPGLVQPAARAREFEDGFRAGQRRRHRELLDQKARALALRRHIDHPGDGRAHAAPVERDELALAEDAQLIPNRKRLTMTWRTDIRTPGLPTNTRRLGDLRLECKVGMEAGLISNSTTFLGKLASAIFDTPAYCDKQAPIYLFFADHPLESVVLVDGQRRQTWSFDKLYAQASEQTELRGNKPYCDCEVLLDRTYVLPLGDKSWPDDSLVEFEYKQDGSAAKNLSGVDTRTQP